MYERIAVAIDGSSTSNQALDAALKLAAALGGRARLRLLHVVDESALISGMDSMGGYPAELFQAIRDDGARIIDDAMKIATAAGIEADSVLFENPGQRLGETVAGAARDWPADLVVVGTHGRRGIAHMLIGSGAEQIIRLAPVPVLVVRSPEKPEGSPP